jgi:Domain of unknown function (DUF4352)
VLVAGALLGQVAPDQEAEPDPTKPAADATSSGSAESSRSAAPSTRASDLDRPRRDEDLRFVVTDFRCGDEELGDLFPREANGRFCFAETTVRNVGDESHTLWEVAQILRDTQGGEHTGDFGARFYFDQTLWDQINPGATVNGTMVFDVAKGRRPQSLELHEEWDSDGVVIRLHSR